jgi:hypothetical protein
VSTILKALRRLEQERDARVERDLRDQVVARPGGAGGPATRLRLPLIAGAGAVGAVLVVALFALLERGGSETAPVRAVASESQAARPAPALARFRERRAPVEAPDAATRAAARHAQGAPVATGLPAPVPVEPPVARAEPASEPAAAPRRTAAIATPRRTALAAMPAPASLPPVAAAAPRELRAQPEPPTPTAPEPTATAAPLVPAAEPAPELPAAVARTSTVAAKPPFQEEPVPLDHERVEMAGPAEVAARAVLPGVVVERTLWHPDASRRLAVLQVEGRDGTVELREGDAVGDLVVQQIDPSGVLFLQRGVEIRRRVGARE